MNKKIIFGVILGLSICNLCISPVYAEELTTGPISADDIDSQTSSDSDSTNQPYDDPIGPGAETPEHIVNCLDDPTGMTNCLEVETDDTESEAYEDLIHDGTSSEAEVVCADPTELGCEDAEVEALEDPELWPLIVSLSALGATVVIIIILNLVGRKKS